MTKIKEFFKTAFILLKWTVEYFATVGIILWFLFRFNILSAHHWWKFFHATLHGFWGFTFGAIIYSAIPIYLAIVIIIYRKKEPPIKFSLFGIITNILLKIFKIFTPTKKVMESDPAQQPELTYDEPEYPTDLPLELRVPYVRAKQNMSLMGLQSSFNQESQSNSVEKSDEPESAEFPIPSDFDISDTINENESENNTADSIMPTFKDINFDEPITPSFPKKNTIMKYFESKNIEYETYNDYVITKKYLVYDHDDEDFWIMDEETWFASGKQKPSPVKEMIELATQNDLTPVIYLESQNIMDTDNTINRRKSSGIRIITKPHELD